MILDSIQHLNIEFLRKEEIQKAKYVNLQNSLKGLILSDSSYKEGNARFTTVPLKAISDQV